MLDRFDCNQPIPILFLGDAPDSPTGLGRIGHDLAWLVSSMPEFKLGYLGRQAFGRSAFPWAQYTFGAHEQWGEQHLERAWNDLAGDRRGIIMTIWDASRLLWFADPKDTGLEAFLGSNRFERWGYFMADASGVDRERLPLEQAHVVSQYQRVLMASQWAYQLLQDDQVIAGPERDWLPHPINRNTFKRRDRDAMRSAWGMLEGQPLVGCVMANQARKHWPVVMQAVSRLGPYARFWVHTDVLMGYWNIPALAVEYGIQDRLIFEGRQLSDTELAMRYSACDVTVMISGGEGFCYPVAESLSCGTPVVTGAWSAQAELNRPEWLVQPVWHAIDTSHNVMRAIYDAADVSSKLKRVLTDQPEHDASEYRVAHLDHPLLGQLWKKWFLRGIK